MGYITRKIFSKRNSQLQELILGAKEVINGNYHHEFKFSGSEEIKEIGDSLNTMLKVIKKNHEEITVKNSELQETLKRIEAIEKILLGIHVETDMKLALKTLLKALTSDIGLGYSRAMYFRYSRELDAFLGEKTVINPSVSLESKGDLNTEFNFQIKNLDSLVKLIKIPNESENLIAAAMKGKNLIYYNEKGYKFDLGNTLFKGLGIQNFMILPIYAKNKKYGCIVVDYFGKDNKISKNEYDLMKLLIMNITIRISNKLTEEERVDNERENTIRKLTERFLGDREAYINSVYSVIEGYRKGEKNLEAKIDKVEVLIAKLRKENKILKEYSELGITQREVINIESIFNEIKAEEYEESRRKGVTISIFSNYTGLIHGNRKDLKKAFFEIMKNSYYALLETNDLDKKMNIIITRDKKIDKIRINIIDNGIGIKPELFEKIYEPFLSVNGKPGLGLSLVYRVIKEHHGVIKFSSKYKEGTDVKITLNAYKEENY